MMCCEDDYKKKKMCLGILFILFGLIWYLKETGSITLEPFWPIMAMLFGFVMILKGFMLKPAAVKKK